MTYPNSPERIVESQLTALAAQPEQFPPPIGVEVAFAGRSNVGKSSLLNTLLGRKNLARTSGTPGCTRQIGFYEARAADGARLTLVDLPGYGYARRSKAERRRWAQLAQRYMLERPTLALVVILFDARRGLEEEEHQLLQLIASPPHVSRGELPCLLVATKVDQLPASSRKLRLQALKRQAQQPVLGFSIRDPKAAQQLGQRIRKQLGLGGPIPQATPHNT